MATNTPVKSVHQGETTKYNPNLPVADQILASAQASRDIVEDFCPLAESLEWELGQQYLRERGNKSFISDANLSSP